MFRTLLLAGAASLALAACNNNQAPEGEDGKVTGLGDGAVSTAIEDTTAQAVGAVTAPLANSADAFVTNAAISDMYEIEAGRLAAEKAKSPEVKAFGETMVKDHTTTSTRLKEVLASANLNMTPPTALDARRQGMVDNLKAASAEEFDKAYLDQQIAAHQETLTLMQSFAEDGDNEALKAFAAETAPKIQQHYEHAQRLDAGGADGSASGETSGAGSQR
jgi:putative membrane protein